MGGFVRPPGPVADGMTVALLGGSFDPPHEGHRHVSLTALRAGGIAYVWWLVSPGNPLKPDPAPLGDRLAQARALARHPRIRVTGIEAELGTRFTIDTLTALQRRFPRLRFVWLMGSDNLVSFARWRSWQRIAARVPIIVVRRPGSVLAPLYAPLTRRFGLARCGPVRLALAPRQGAAPCILVLDGRRSAASSTALRLMLGDPIDTMLNPLL